MPFLEVGVEYGSCAELIAAHASFIFFAGSTGADQSLQLSESGDCQLAPAWQRDYGDGELRILRPLHHQELAVYLQQSLHSSYQGALITGQRGLAGVDRWKNQ